MFIRDNSAWINKEIAFEVMELKRSSYYEWETQEIARLQKLAAAKSIEAEVVIEFVKKKKRYGATRLTDSLNKRNVKCSYKKVSAIMSKLQLVPTGYKKFKITTTDSNHKHKVFENLLARNFNVDKPNLAWVGDITYIRTDQGWVYLATVIDLYSRKVIGHSISSRMTKDLVISALVKAIKSRGYPTGVIVHSDRGSQYASNEYKRILKQYNLHGSMSRKGDCWDNAVAESFFASIKKEYIYQTKFVTKVQAALGVFDYIEAWYNNERIHSHLGVMSPNEFEQENKDKFIQKKPIMKAPKNAIITQLNLCI